MNQDPKKTICVQKWAYPVPNLASNEFKMCCKVPFRKVNISDISTDSLINSQYEKDRRLEMLRGIRHSDCITCWKVEDAGGISMRIRENVDKLSFQDYLATELIEEFGTTDIDEISKVVNVDSKILVSNKPFRMEIKIGTLCDLKCVYCSRTYSTQWALSDLNENLITREEFKIITSTDISSAYTDNLWHWVDTSAKYHLKFIGIIGGEPTIMPEFYTQVDRLLSTYTDIPPGETSIWIVTNLNTPAKYFEKFLSYLNKLSKQFTLHITISIESMYDQAEFIRSNLDWNTFSDNLHKLLSSNINISLIAMNPVINLLTIPRLTEFMKWHYALIQQYGRFINLSQSLAAKPDYLFPFILPATFSHCITECIEYVNSNEYKDANFKHRYIEFLTGIELGLSREKKIDKSALNDFYINMEKTSKHLGVNFVDVFPELTEFYLQCEQINKATTDKGYIIFAQNSKRKDFTRCAYALALSIKLHNKDANISVITDSMPDNYRYIFDKIIHMSCVADPSFFVTENKWMIYEFTPYNETIVLDADILVLNDISHYWEYFKDHDICFTDKVYDYRSNIITDNYYRKPLVDNNVPSYYQTMHYFKKTPFTEHFTSVLKHISGNWQEYYKKYLPIDEKTFLYPSMDLIIGIAVKMLKYEHMVTARDNPAHLVHMKPMIQGWPNATEPWMDFADIQFNSTCDLTVGGYRQQGLFHYVNDTFLTDDMIGFYENMINKLSIL